jgi:hypothetical protein
VLAAQHLLELGALHDLLQLVERGLQVLLHVLSRLQPFHQHARVVLAAAQALEQVEVGLQALAALEQLLGRGLVRPEVGGRHALVDAGQLGAELGVLKGSRGCPRPSRPCPATSR